MNWRACRVQFPTQRIVIAVLAMVGFGVRVRCGVHVLKIRFRQRRLILRQRMLSSAAGGKENDGDEHRQQNQGKVTTLGVGQGEPPSKVINTYSQFGKAFFESFGPRILHG